jgi:uncharacterized protein with HEPN domain
MHSESLESCVYDIRDNILYAQGLLAGLAYEDFRASRTHFYAATRALEIISEASRRLPDEVRARHPHLPWRAIMYAGNVYRHRYDDVDESRVWDTVHLHLPSLLTAVLAEIKALESSQSSG